MTNTEFYAAQDAALIDAVLTAEYKTLGAVAPRGVPMISVKAKVDSNGNWFIRVVVCGGGHRPSTPRKYKAAQELIAHAASLTDLRVEVK